MEISLHGIWKADIGDGKSYPLKFPGTLDENRIGYKDVGIIEIALYGTVDR